MKARQVFPLILSLCVLIIALTTVAAYEQRRDTARTDMQKKQGENQQLQRALAQLQADQAVTKLTIIKAGMEAIRLNFIETLVKTKELPELVDLQYSMGDGRTRSAHPDYLRTALHLELRHADTLLTVVERLNRAASVWPHLLRGCVLQRQKASVGLAATCIYDVYVWDALS